MKQLAVFLMLVLAVAGCSDHDATSPESYLVTYQIGMDRMEIVAPESQSEPLIVRLFGVIGPDTRYAFDHAVISATATDYELTLYGVRNDDPELGFIPVIVEWNGREFIKPAPSASTVHVVLHQPDGSALEETVIIGPLRD